MSLKGNIADTQTLKGNAMMSDGFSPIVEVEKTEAGHKVIITDRYGEQEFNVLNGKDGEKGDTGEFPLDQVKRDFSPSIITSASGETVVTTDSANATPSIKLFGKSTQNTVAGNQLLNLPNVESRTHNGITWSCNNGVVKVVGTTTNIADSSHPTVGLYYDYPVKAGTYYVSGNGANVLVLVAVTNADGSAKYYNQRSFVLDGTETNCHIYLGVQIVGTTVNETLYPMLNKGTTALPFEPYVGGEQSPSLAYPQDVVPHGASGSIEQTLFGRNICPKFEGTTTHNGVTFTFKDGYVTVVGTKPADIAEGNSTSLRFYLPIIKGTYTLPKANDRFIGIVMVITCADGSRKFISEQYTLDGTEKEVRLYVSARRENAELTVNETIPLSITVGTERLPYEEYKGEQVLVHQTPNGLHGIPLGQTIPSEIANSPIHMSGVYWDNVTSQYWIGDYKDYGSGKNVQVTWNGKPTKTIVFSEQNTNTSSSAYGRCHVYDKNLFGHEFAGWDYVPVLGFCNRIVNDRYATKNNTFSVSGFSFYYKDAEKTLEEVNVIFAEIGTDIEFTLLLNNPIITDLTEEELAQYNAIHMNYPNTTIVNSDSAYTEVEYVADTKCYIDNKFKELETNITSAMAQLL
jgi:hypothetical protein